MRNKQDVSVRISLADRSLYYKGLMLLIRKDRKIHDEERNMMIHIGKMLGFESGFCENAIEEIMDNKHIIDSPPLFSEQGIALCFVRDGLRLAKSDQQIHKAEIAWLEAVADKNGLSSLWAGEFEKFCLTGLAKSLENSLEMRHFKWEYRRQCGTVAT
jgi:hypothetical protein